MAKERLHELKQTKSEFKVSGIVTGTKSKRFYKSGNSANGAWNAVEFGITFDEGKTVYLSMRGFTRSEVFYYKKGEGSAKGDTKRVPWRDRNKAPGAGYALIGVDLSVGKDETGKNINSTMTEYDAVEHLRANLRDGDSVLVVGELQFSSYTDRNGETKKRTELVPTKIYYTGEPIVFSEQDKPGTCEFYNTLVFSGIDKEMDDRDKHTGRYILSGFSVSYANVEPVSFIMNKSSAKLADNMRKKLKYGNAIKTYGRVDVIVDTSTVEEEDDGWGERSPMQRINSPVRREYVVYKADPKTIDVESYSEEAIAMAIRKIKAAKTAEENFNGKAKKNITIEVDDDWSVDDSEDAPW